MKRKTALLMVLILTVLSVGCGKTDKKKEPVTYLVRFEMDGGRRVSGSLHQEIEEGEAAVAPTLEKDGYVFDGWDGRFDEITSDTIVRARWKKLVTVSFDINGGDLVSGSEKASLTVGQKPVAPEVKKKGYTFITVDELLEYPAMTR